ncbi:MAG: lysine--tRNA ligase, partial [Candidatus Hydrothermarchaeaceae archaeon]
DAGKMMWKGEWAAQWARWKVSSEGAGKEYVVPTSAWWVNAEIVERILKFPMPVPIFYEHLMIDGKKMSASLGNVVYPREWLDVAPPELLRFFYNKKLMKTRSFSWKNLPMLYDDYDLHAGVYYGKGNKNERERKHMERLYEISQLGDINRQLNLSFSHAAVISQFFKDRRAIIESLKRLGIYDEKILDDTLERIELAGNWVQKHAPEEQRINLDVDIASVRAKLNDRQKSFLGELSGWLEREHSAEQIHEKIYEISKEMKLPGGDAFQAVYIALLDRREGPKAGAFIASLDRDWVVKRFVEVSK